MGLLVTKFYFCDWHAARDIDVAIEAEEHPGVDEDVPVPAGWVHIEVSRVIQNPDYMDQYEARASVAAALVEQQTAQGDVGMSPNDLFERVMSEQLTLSPIDVSPIEIEVTTYALSPQRAGWLALIGADGYGGDPSRVLAVAGAALGVPALPAVEDLVEVFVEAEANARNDGIDNRAAVSVGMRAVLDIIRASMTPPSADALERAIQHAIETTEPTEDTQPSNVGALH
jgi:hypothetical protein